MLSLDHPIAHAAHRLPPLPLLHIYFFMKNPEARQRARRYVAYQMEYADAVLKSQECLS